MSLVQLAQRSPNPQTFINVKELVQKLIDNSVTVNTFAERLQSEMPFSPQVMFSNHESIPIPSRLKSGLLTLMPGPDKIQRNGSE